MARIEWVEQNLLNWGRWVVSRTGGSLGYAAVNLQRVEVTQDRYREAVIPISDCDAAETDKAIASLGAPFVETLKAVYVLQRESRWTERHLGCSASTIKARVWEAHRRIAMWFTERAATARNHRARVEQLQQSARP